MKTKLFTYLALSVLAITGMEAQTIPLKYKEYRGGRYLYSDYQAVRVGEHLWMNRNFSDEYNSSTKDGDTGAYYMDYNGWGYQHYHFYKPATTDAVNLGFRRWGNFYEWLPSFWSYGVTLADFNRHFGVYATMSRMDYMDWNGKMLENGVERNDWRLPHESDTRQLLGMCGYGANPKEVAQYLAYSNDDISAPKFVRIPNVTGGYWFFSHSEPNAGQGIYDGFTRANNNKYKFNLVPAGSRYEYWPGGQGGHPHVDPKYRYFNPNPGDFKQLLQVAKINMKYSTLQIEDRVVITYSNTRWGSKRTSEWHPLRWCRRLTDQELGYKLYINKSNFRDVGPGEHDSSEEILIKSIWKTKELHPNLSIEQIIRDYAKVNIIKLALNQAPPAGYSELPRGIIRGLYVQYIIGKPTLRKTVNDILFIAQNNRNLWKYTDSGSGVDLYMTRGVLSASNIDSSDAELLPTSIEEVLNENEDRIHGITVYDQSGRLVTKASDKTYIIESLKPGVYVFKLATDSGVKTVKVLKSK